MIETETNRNSNDKLIEMVLYSFTMMTKMIECILSVQETVLLLCQKNSNNEDKELKASIQKLISTKQQLEAGKAEQ